MRKEQECMELETIPLEQLELVGGGGLISRGQKLGAKVYEWWTHSPKLPSPKQVFDEVWNVGAKAGGAIAAGYYAAKNWLWPEKKPAPGEE